MKGCYILIIKLNDTKEIEVGKLGKIEFKAGIYAYVGSGMNNVIKRVLRHFKREKRRRWHIDYLTTQADEMYAIILPISIKIECLLAKILSMHFEPIDKFGCSDCNCRSHLFYIKPFVPTASFCLKL